MTIEVVQAGKVVETISKGRVVRINMNDGSMALHSLGEGHGFTYSQDAYHYREVGEFPLGSGILVVDGIIYRPR